MDGSEDDASENDSDSEKKATDHDSGAEVEEQKQNPRKKGLKTKKGQVLVRASNKATPTVRSKKVKNKPENAKEVEETQPDEEKMEVEKSEKEEEAEGAGKIADKTPGKKETRPEHIKDKHWRDVSNMTEKQKAKYFKSRAIRKCVKLRQQGKGKKAAGKKKE